MKNYGEKIRAHIRSISNNSGSYDAKRLKVKFDSDNDLPLKKTLELHNMIIVVRSVFNFLDACLCKLGKNDDNRFYNSIIMLRSGETKIAKEEFYDAKNQ